MRPSILLALMTVVFRARPAPLPGLNRRTFHLAMDDAIDKDHAVEKSLKSLRAEIDKWKAGNSVTGPVTEAAEKPQPHPFWRAGFISCVSSTRCRERLCVYDLLEWRDITSSLHLRCTAVLVRVVVSPRARSG